jgi:hypothetical protein
MMVQRTTQRLVSLRRIQRGDVLGIARCWVGQQHVITVRADDFEFEGRPYQSLSAIARHITGTRWNGWTFFGLRSRGDPVRPSASEGAGSGISISTDVGRWALCLHHGDGCGREN